ncbi:MAG: leucine-rich repeat domain-containing protein, partial [Clostridia bacterium]|nr:leucine-rich repeat domain-containing protein [Clostridia bacterium]
MKKSFVILLALFLCFLSTGCNAPTKGLYFDAENGECAVRMSEFCTDKSIVIPAEHDGLPVTKIRSFGYSDIKSIKIPDSVTTIWPNAFLHCLNLKSITIPENVTTIGESAFAECESLKDFHIPKSVTSIGEKAFYGCKSLKSVTVAEDNPVFEVKGNCLIDKTTKTLVLGFNDSVIPTDGSVEIIGNYAFALCESIDNIVIPDSVIAIGNYAFSNCIGITDITIPDSVKKIGSCPFEKCKNLKNIYCEATE